MVITPPNMRDTQNEEVISNMRPKRAAAKRGVDQEAQVPLEDVEN